MRRLLVLWLALGILPLAQAETVRVETDQLQLEFAANGDLLRARACLPRCADGEHVREFGHENGLVTFTRYASEPFRFSRGDADDEITLAFEHSENVAWRRWRIPRQGYRIELDLAGAERVDLRPGAALNAPPAAGFGVWLEQPRYITLRDGTVENLPASEPPMEVSGHGWTGARNRFWAALVRTTASAALSPAASGEESAVVLSMDPDRAEQLAFYLGPVEPAALRSAAPELHGLLYASLWFWLRWICMGLFWLFSVLHLLIPNWALAIMALSLAVGLLMRPLSRIADRLQDEVHRTEGRLAPQLREIQANYRGEEQSKRVLALYKEHGVHPLYSLKSLAGVAVVIPVFIGAFDMLAENIWLAGQSVLWIADLARPDALAALPFTIPFFGSEFNLLPFIMTILSVVASVLHRHEAMDAGQFARHKRNLTLMALAFLALFYTFPAGMVLYWTTNNLISVIKYARRARQNGAPGKAQD